MNRANNTHIFANTNSSNNGSSNTGYQFNNQSNNNFTDISSERVRIYEGWTDGFSVKIDNPLQLSVSKSGGHRIFDAQGGSHYIQPGWKHLHWTVRKGEPNFVK
jgi:hypothetical protein